VRYGLGRVSSVFRPGTARRLRSAAAAQLASGASRAACYGGNGAAGPRRIVPTPQNGPLNLAHSRSA